MPEGLTTLEISAQALSSELFDRLVEDALAGNDRKISITQDDNAADSEPVVTIGGMPTTVHVTRCLGFKQIKGRELVDQTTQLFDRKMVRRWDDTITYYLELETLGPVMDELADATSEAGYYSQVEQDLRDGGIDPEQIGDRAKASAARELACTAFKSLFETTPSI